MMFTEGQLVNGKYLVQSEIAQGDFGPVYRALDVEGGGLWVLSPMTLVPAEAESFREELERIRALEHPNIVPPGELEMTEQNQPFLAGEFVEGRTLEELLRDEAPLALPRACSLARQMAMALEGAHHEGIVHGDLKPSNVLVVRDEDEEEIAMVRGFETYPIKRNRFINLAHLAVRDDGRSLFGTPEYISPEQAVGTSAEALDGRSDLYSLGVILYRMLTGELPHQGANAMEVLLAQIFAEPRPFSARPGCETPVVVETLVMRTLAKKRGERPASATALIDQLAAWEGRKAPARRPAVAASPEPEPLGREVFVRDTQPAVEPAIIPDPVPQWHSALEMPPSGAQVPLAPSREPTPPPKESFVPDLEPVPESARAPEPIPHAPPALDFPPAQIPVSGLESGSPPGEGFVADLEHSVEPAAVVAPAPVPDAGHTQWAGQATDPFAYGPTQTQSGGIDVQFGVPGPPQSSSVAAGNIKGTPPIVRVPVPVPAPARAAASGPVLFANYHPRPKSKRKWPKVLGIAAIVVLILVAAGCGWLYYTGRTYWFNPDYVKMRVSSFLDYGTAGNSPQVETDAYSESKAPDAASNAAPTPTQSAPSGTNPPASITQSTTPGNPSALPLMAPARPLHSTAAATPPVRGADANPEHPREAPKASPALEKRLTHASHAIENPAGLVEAAVTRGDYYFNRGDYDAAIRAYTGGLAYSPSNPQLVAEIARAKKAKAAEAKYLQ